MTVGVVLTLSDAHADSRVSFSDRIWLDPSVPTEEDDLPEFSDLKEVLDSIGKTSWCCPCGPPGTHWIRAEYLAWWMTGSDTPPLVTTSPPGTAIGDAGVIGAPGTTIVYGGSSLNDDLQHGFRLRAGTWLNCERTCGIEASFFMLCPDSGSFRAGSADGSAIVGRPWIDANTGQNEAELVSYPDELAGFVNVRSRSSLLGAEALFRHNLCCDPCCCYDPCNPCRTCIRRDLLVGFRYLNFGDSVTISESLQPLGPAFVPGTQIDVVDRFRTQNNFYGLKVGLDCARHRGRWSLEARPQVSVGILDQQVSIRGRTEVAVPGEPTLVYEGGLMALSSNIGTYRSSQFAIVPELDLQVGYLIRPNLRVTLGYSCLYFPDLVRAGEQIDPVINPELIPPVTNVTGPLRPEFRRRESDAWIQGVTAGLEYRW
jgi:hypothetical protein